MSNWYNEHPLTRGTALPADLVADLDDQALVLALHGASIDDQAVLQAEIDRRGLVV